MTAREHNISMDELKFANAWSRGGMSNAKIPVKITGIKIEGAVFDGVKLSECSWDSSTYSTGNILFFRNVIRGIHKLQGAEV